MTDELQENEFRRLMSEEDEQEMFDEMFALENEQKQKWEQAKQELQGLIEPKYFTYAEINERYSSEGVFEIEETDKRNSGYENYRHCTVKDWQDNRLFMHNTTSIETLDGDSEHEGQRVEGWVWQQTGYLGDDFYGYLLLPMLNGKYWMVCYSC
jgi:hypothetical protein